MNFEPTTVIVMILLEFIFSIEWKKDMVISFQHKSHKHKLKHNSISADFPSVCIGTSSKFPDRMYNENFESVNYQYSFHPNTVIWTANRISELRGQPL